MQKIEEFSFIFNLVFTLQQESVQNDFEIDGFFTIGVCGHRYWNMYFWDTPVDKKEADGMYFASNESRWFKFNIGGNIESRFITMEFCGKNHSENCNVIVQG